MYMLHLSHDAFIADSGVVSWKTQSGIGIHKKLSTCPLIKARSSIDLNDHAKSGYPPGDLMLPCNEVHL